MEKFGALLRCLSAPYSKNSISFRFGRDNFQDAARMASRMESSAIDWSKFKYMVFDIPNHQGTYGERYNQLGICAIAIVT